MAGKYKYRSEELELMDQPQLNKQELWTNLHELVFINKMTGGPANTFRAIQKVLENQRDEVHIVDIGFGAGDMLQYILDNQTKLNCRIRLTGVDLMPEMKAFALEKYPELAQKVKLETASFEEWFAAGNKADLIVTGLFCHHLSDNELQQFFNFAQHNSRLGAICNDLVRSPIAYYGIKWPTMLFSKSTYTKNDAPLSVLRGFKRKELEALLMKANVSRFSIKWKWAFRYIIQIHGNEND